MKIEPRPQAYEKLAAVHPPLATARTALGQARKRLDDAGARLAELDDEVARLSDTVACGGDTQTLEKALRARDVVREIVKPAERAIAQAETMVDEEVKRALVVLAASIRERRERLHAAMPKTLARDLQRLKEAEIDLVDEADSVLNTLNHRMLDGHDLGAPLSWPCCWSDEVAMQHTAMHIRTVGVAR